jgi:DNA polymerase-3 subunit delta
MPLKKLKNALADLKPIYLVLGPESLLLQQAEQAVGQAVLTGAASLNHDVCRAGEENAGEVFAKARTLPMMSARRLVVLRDAQEAPPALLEALYAYAEDPSPSTVLLVTGTKWPPAAGGADWGRRAENLIARTGFALRQKAQDVDPVGFVVEQAQVLGCQIRRDRAVALVERVGPNLATLQSELEKLAEWLDGSGEITDAALAAVSSLVADADRWDLTGALVRGDVDTALATLHRLLEDGEEPPVVFGLIAWQMRQVLALQGALRRGQTPKDVGVNLYGRNLDAARDMLRRHPLDTVGILDQLVRANSKMNSSRAGARRVLEGLVLGLASRA